MWRFGRASLAVIAALLLVGAAAAVLPRGSRASPYPLHVYGAIPKSAGWQVKVLAATPDATEQILASNALNKPPASGRQFFIVSIAVRFSGRGAVQMIQGVVPYALGRSGKKYDAQLDGCGLVNGLIDDLKRLRRGQTLTGNLCFSVKRSDAPRLLLLIEPASQLPGRVQVFFKTH